jgi:hypothetical protein
MANLSGRWLAHFLSRLRARGQQRQPACGRGVTSVTPPRASRAISQHDSSSARSWALPRWTRDFIPETEMLDASAASRIGRPWSSHPPRVLTLYGSLREKSFSRYLAEECGRVLTGFGAEVRTYDPRDLPVFDRQRFELPKVRELRELTLWS